MKKSNFSEDTRLKSAVQFKFQQFLTSKPTPINTTRLQTGTTTSRNIEDCRKSQYSEPKFLGIVKRVSSQISLDRPIEDGYHSQNQSMKVLSSERTTTRASQKIIVTQDNLQTSEIKRRMKFDPAIRHQVSMLRIKILKNVSLKKFLLQMVNKERILMELIRLKHIPQAVDILQNLVELAIGTKNVTVFVEIMLFAAETLENCESLDLAIHFYNQVRILCTNAKQTLDQFKMKSLIGLANCCLLYQNFEGAIKFLKKCLQYAWMNNSQEYENLVYQKFGKCYYYLGYIEKATFYHERYINYDYELENSPLRQLSCDTLRNYLNKYYPKNFAETINTLLISKLNLKFPVDIEKFAEELQRPSEYSPSPKIFLSKDCSRRVSISNDMRELASLQLDGIKLINQILSQQEFDFEVYTPKHSFRTESSCFNFLKQKKMHPQDFYHDPRYNTNPFMTNDLGVIKDKHQMNFAEYLSKYKLSLQKKIDIRLQQNFDINIDQTLKMAISSNNKVIEKKNKILLTHQNQENTKKNKLQEETKKLNDINTLFQNLVKKLLSN